MHYEFYLLFFSNINSSVKLHEIKLGIDNGDESLLMWNVMKQLIKKIDESVRVVQKEDKKELVEA